MLTAVIVGADSAPGRALCADFQHRGYYVVAIVAPMSDLRFRTLVADQRIEADFSDPASLEGVLTGASIVLSALPTPSPEADDASWVTYARLHDGLRREACRCAVACFTVLTLPPTAEVFHLPTRKTPT